MKNFARCAAVALSLVANVAAAEEPTWEFAATGYWNEIKGGDGYANGIFTADRGPIHLEARVNYEARHAQSAFAGWTFTAGEGVTLEATPILGYVWGDVKGAIAGVEATVAWGRFDWYVEAEYVHDRARGKTDSYTYAWSELGFRPVEALRLGLVAQRTRAYGGDREVQRGGFVQYEFGKVTAGIYWFNPGSSDQVVTGALGVSF